MSKKLTAEEIAKYYTDPFKPYMPNENITAEEIESHSRELAENIEAFAQSRLKAIAEEVEGKISEQKKRKDRFGNDSLNSHIYISAMDKETAFREVLQIIQQHMD